MSGDTDCKCGDEHPGRWPARFADYTQGLADYQQIRVRQLKAAGNYIKDLEGLCAELMQRIAHMEATVGALDEELRRMKEIVLPDFA